MSNPSGPDVLDGKRHLNLETYRKSGKGVRTPVWFAAAPDARGGGGTVYYVYSTADSSKAKRLRRSDVAKVAPCDLRGNVTGSWMEARAKIVSGDDFNRGMQLLNEKYRPWKQVLDFLSSFSRGHQRVMIEIRLV